MVKSGSRAVRAAEKTETVKAASVTIKDRDGEMGRGDPRFSPWFSPW